MLSICIPVYNVDVRILVNTLAEQSSNTDKPCEIICIDDCSLHEYKEINHEIAPLCEKYIELPANIGRAKIRNLFTQYARFDHLLFLDCDLVVTHTNFLDRYIEAIVSNPESVLCGGIGYMKEPPPRNFSLRWNYGIHKESIPLNKRLLNPYQSFMTGNFVIRKNILQAFPFDERLAKYGHEDTLMGYRLKKEHILISHIDNKVIHTPGEDNLSFLEKTATGIESLVLILQHVRFDPGFIADVTLLKTYFSLKKKGIIPFIDFIFKLLQPSIVHYYQHGGKNLLLFDFFKLGTFIEKIKKSLPLHNNNLKNKFLE